MMWIQLPDGRIVFHNDPAHIQRLLREEGGVQVDDPRPKKEQKEKALQEEGVTQAPPRVDNASTRAENLASIDEAVTQDGRADKGDAHQQNSADDKRSSRRNTK